MPPGCPLEVPPGEKVLAELRSQYRSDVKCTVTAALARGIEIEHVVGATNVLRALAEQLLQRSSTMDLLLGFAHQDNTRATCLDANRTAALHHFRCRRRTSVRRSNGQRMHKRCMPDFAQAIPRREIALAQEHERHVNVRNVVFEARDVGQIFHVEPDFQARHDEHQFFLDGQHLVLPSSPHV